MPQLKSKTAKKSSQLVITMAAFSEFALAPKLLKNRASREQSVQRKAVRDGKQITISTKSTRGFSMAKLSRKVVCITCGNGYNGSTAPIEPLKYCSRICEEATEEGERA